MRGDFFFLNVVLSERLCLRNWGARDGEPKRTRLLWMREVIKRTAWASGCHLAARFHSLSCTCAEYAAAREAHILSMPPCGLRSAWKYFPLRWGFSFSGLDAMNPIRPYGAANLAPHVHVDDSANDAPTTTTRHWCLIQMWIYHGNLILLPTNKAWNSRD